MSEFKRIAITQAVYDELCELKAMLGAGGKKWSFSKAIQFYLDSNKQKEKVI